MAWQEDEIVQVLDVASRNIKPHAVLDERSQALMSWSKETASRNIITVIVMLLMFQLLIGWLKASAP